MKTRIFGTGTRFLSGIILLTEIVMCERSRTVWGGYERRRKRYHSDRLMPDGAYQVPRFMNDIVYDRSTARSREKTVARGHRGWAGLTRRSFRISSRDLCAPSASKRNLDVGPDWQTVVPIN